MSAMERTDSSAAMASLAMYADASDSDDEHEPRPAVDNISDDEHDTPTPNPNPSSQHSTRPSSRPNMDEDSDTPDKSAAKKKKLATRLVSYVGDELEDDDEEEEEGSSPEEVRQEHGTSYVEGKVMISSLNLEQASSLSRSMLNKSLDEIELPPEPVTKCPRHLQEKIAKLHDRRRKEGLNLNDTIQRRVDFRNPSIYEKLIEFCGIDEKGTNYPPELFDTSIWDKESYYDALDKSQKADMEKREKDRKERTKVEFVTATKKSGSKTEITSSHQGKHDDKKRKSKWDESSSQSQAGRIADSINKSIAANPNLTSMATGTKSTVIPATGKISKSK